MNSFLHPGEEGELRTYIAAGSRGSVEKRTSASAALIER